MRDGSNQNRLSTTLSTRKPHDPRLVQRIMRIALLRDHWKIDNSQHYVHNVTFSEDASRIRKSSAPEVSGGFRRIALNILQQGTTWKTRFATSDYVRTGACIS